ncbi:MAG TPA: hypothetical protein VF832_05075, partial [Longimicrobiales bacterium]
VVAVAWPAAAAAQLPRPPAEPPAKVVFYGVGGVSMRTDPLQTHIADVWTGSGRLAVPIGKFAPFVSGALARVKTPCTTPNCSNRETRFLGGLEYISNGGGPGAYAGLGLGVRDYRGTQDLAHSFFIGLTIPGTPYVAPTFELRSEGYRDLNELLIIGVGLRFSLPRPAPPPPAGS